MQPAFIPEFEDLRSALQADGADLELKGVENGVAGVRLLLGPETCLECIMPKQALEQILLASLRGSGDHQVERVELDDPRLED